MRMHARANGVVFLHASSSSNRRRLSTPPQIDVAGLGGPLPRRRIVSDGGEHARGGEPRGRPDIPLYGEETRRARFVCSCRSSRRSNSASFIHPCRSPWHAPVQVVLVLAAKLLLVPVTAYLLVSALGGSADLAVLAFIIGAFPVGTCAHTLTRPHTLLIIFNPLLCSLHIYCITHTQPPP